MTDDIHIKRYPIDAAFEPIERLARPIS